MSAFELPSSSESSCSDADTEPEWVYGTSVLHDKRAERKCNIENLQNSQAVASVVEEGERSKQRKGREMIDSIGHDEENVLYGGLGHSGVDAYDLEAIKNRGKGVIRGHLNREFGSRRNQVEGNGTIPIKRGGPIVLPVPPVMMGSSSTKSNIGNVS